MARMVWKETVFRGAIAATVMVAGFANVSRAYADGFVKPTQEELSMTSLPGYPGAPAVVLYREQITKDDLHVQQFYDRIKILTEDGKKYANVELGFYTSAGDGVYEGDENNIGDIVGRTIHADGTIIPFTGKPYLKVVEKGKDFKMQERVFTLPDAEVGSIIEYRYALRYNDHVFESPRWYIQGELYLKAAHYMWYPTSKELTDPETESPINSISWWPILPAGAAIKRTETPPSGTTPAQQVYELNIKDVPPELKEEYMPPIGSFTYRVLYNFTPYRSAEEYWKSKGKKWSKKEDSFIGPNNELKAATQAVIAGATTDDEKLRKIYATVMSLENTNFSRAHEQQEDKASGQGKVNNAADVLSHKRGNGDQMVDLFVGMARAAGMKAYVMLVTARSDNMFAQGWLNFGQLNSSIAIVNVGGKEMYFEPGGRYTPYGQLEWSDTFAQGVRQTDGGGTAFASAPGENYTANKLARVANMTMDEQGGITGTISLTFTGAGATDWRQRGLRGDDESLKRSLREYLENRLPKTLELEVSEIQNLADYEKPFVVKYTVKGMMGVPTGKRLVIPVDLFEAQSTAAFSHEKREIPVYFHYPQTVQDALRINFPKNISLEGAPTSSKFMMNKSSAYMLDVTSTATNVTVRRSFVNNEIVYPMQEYGDLRKFYADFEAKDHESVVLKQTPVETSSSAAPPGN